MRSLWQILITIKNDSTSTSLTCDECFAYMEHLVEEALVGVEEDALKAGIRQHMDHCPDCQNHHLQKLSEMEEKRRVPDKDFEKD
jgi:uncharacterized protein with PIN domain